MKRTSILRRATPEEKLTGPVFRPRPCKVCREKFTPTRQMQPVCAPPKPCAFEYGMKAADKSAAARAKAERKADRAKRETVKRRADWVAEAQAAFNRWVKLRDEEQPCISCGRHHGGAWHAGHYLSTGARPNLRFAETNVHKQCAPCNMHLHGNLINYRLGLIDRIGITAVELLEADHLPRHYSIDDLKAIKTEYAAKSRALKKSAD